MTDYDDYSSCSKVRSLYERRFKPFREIDAVEQLLFNLKLAPSRLIHEIFGESTAPDLAAEFANDEWIAVEVFEIINPRRRIAEEHNYKLKADAPEASKPRRKPQTEVAVPNYQIWSVKDFGLAVAGALEVKEKKLLPVRNSGKFSKIILCLCTDEATIKVDLVEACRDLVQYDGLNIDECYVQFGYQPGESKNPFVRLF